MIIAFVLSVIFFSTSSAFSKNPSLNFVSTNTGIPFASATLQLTPWPTNSFPKFKTIHDLHKWLTPLLDDEENYNLSKKPFSYGTSTL